MSNIGSAKRKYATQKCHAKIRNIEWDITFDEWYNWWLAQGVDKIYASKHGPDQLCMCRKGDTGPYHINNIYCATQRVNSREMHKNYPNLDNKLKSGIDNPFIKAVCTPLGEFFSIQEAAQQLNVHRDTIKYRMKVRPNEYYFKE